MESKFDRIHTISSATGVPEGYLKTLALNYMSAYQGSGEHPCFELTGTDFIHVFSDWKKTLAELNTFAAPFGWEFVIGEKRMLQPMGATHITHLVLRSKQ